MLGSHGISAPFDASRFHGRFGPPLAEADHGDSRGALWLVEDRVVLVRAEGTASVEGAHWATETMDRVIRGARALHGRSCYVAWSFESIRGYGPTVGAHFVQWFHLNRSLLNRVSILSANPVLRMTARAASLAFRGAATFPETTEEFDSILQGWLEHIHAHS